MKIQNSKLKIIFFGTPAFIEPVINVLDERFDLVKVFRSPAELNDVTTQELISLHTDLFVVASFGKILPEKFLGIPKLGAINIHPSLLPKYRGPSPIQNTILEGDEKTGITIIKMDEKMDHGPIVKQVEKPVLPTDTFESLAKRLFQQSADLLEEVLTHFDEIEPKPQEEQKATYTKILTKQDGFIDIDKFEISNFKFQIERAVRAYHPWPGIWTRLRLSSDGQAKVIKLLPKHMIQVEGKKPMSYKDFINGYENGKDFLVKLFLI